MTEAPVCSAEACGLAGAALLEESGEAAVAACSFVCSVRRAALRMLALSRTSGALPRDEL